MNIEGGNRRAGAGDEAIAEPNEGANPSQQSNIGGNRRAGAGDEAIAELNEGANQSQQSSIVGGNRRAGAGDEAIAESNEGANPSQQSVAALMNRIKSSSECVAFISLLVLISCFVQHNGMKSVNTQPKNVSELLVICIVLAMTTLLLSTFLCLFIGLICPENPGGYYKFIKFLAHGCSVLLMITSYLLLLLANTSHAVMVVVLLMMIALLVVLLYKGMRVDHSTDAAAFARREDDLKRLLDFTVDVAYIFYGGLIGRVFGNFKSLPKGSTQDNNSSSNNLKFPELLIFFGSLFTALGLVLSSTPPVFATDNQNANRREDCVVRALEYYNNACAVVAIAAMLAPAYELVGDFVILALVPEMVAVMAWVVVNLNREGRRAPDNVDPPHHRPASLAVTALVFGVAMAMFLNIGGSPASFYQETLFLFITATVVSGLGLRMLVHRAPNAAAYVLEFSYWMLLIAAALLLLAGLFVVGIP